MQKPRIFCGSLSKTGFLTAKVSDGEVGLPRLRRMPSHPFHNIFKSHRP